MVKLGQLMKIVYTGKIEIYVMDTGKTIQCYNSNMCEYIVRTVEVKRDEKGVLKDVLKIIVSEA